MEVKYYSPGWLAIMLPGRDNGRCEDWQVCSCSVLRLRARRPLGGRKLIAITPRRVHRTEFRLSNVSISIMPLSKNC